jgi:hypothetical protein
MEEVAVEVVPRQVEQHLIVELQVVQVVDLQVIVDLMDRVLLEWEQEIHHQ